LPGFTLVKTILRMAKCHWTARRLQRYIDADPAALLPAADARRIESHLRDCDRCQASEDEYRNLAKLLHRLHPHGDPDPGSVERVRAQAADAIRDTTQ
jgi:anti-sigma factor RsiW